MTEKITERERERERVRERERKRGKGKRLYICGSNTLVCGS